MDAHVLGLFDAYGVELEYMVVDDPSLNVRPIVDRLLTQQAGRLVSDVNCGVISWSNELALHVVEFKTTDPAPNLAPLADEFQRQVVRANELLSPWNARLMPTGMHPWMDPERELRLWPHDYNPVYQAYDRIFDCRGHGWANLQSVHVNLPFGDEREFGRLLAAVRLVVPMLAALTASSPVVDRRLTPTLDNRLEFYRHNSDRVPSVMAGVVPEAVFSKDQYEESVLQRMYRDIRPLDPDGVLQHEWLNARGAIARFDRQTIEIRVMDVQECPAMDLVPVQLVVAVIERIVGEQWTGFDEQSRVAQSILERLFVLTLRHGRQAVVDDTDYLRQFGLGPGKCSVGEIWQRLAQPLLASAPRDVSRRVSWVLQAGNLAERISQAVRQNSPLEEVYRQLCECLTSGRAFKP